MNRIKLNEYFCLSEFSCPCCKRVMLDERLFKILTCMRISVKEPLTITSGYRCPAHNKEVKGFKTSAHIWGGAVDIHCYETSVSALEVLARHYGAKHCYHDTKKNFCHVGL